MYFEYTYLISYQNLQAAISRFQFFISIDSFTVIYLNTIMTYTNHIWNCSSQSYHTPCNSAFSKQLLKHCTIVYFCFIPNKCLMWIWSKSSISKISPAPSISHNHCYKKSENKIYFTRKNVYCYDSFYKCTSSCRMCLIFSTSNDSWY